MPDFEKLIRTPGANLIDLCMRKPMTPPVPLRLHGGYGRETVPSAATASS